MSLSNVKEGIAPRSQSFDRTATGIADVVIQVPPDNVRLMTIADHSPVKQREFLVKLYSVLLIQICVLGAVVYAFVEVSSVQQWFEQHSFEFLPASGALWVLVSLWMFSTQAGRGRRRYSVPFLILSTSVFGLFIGALAAATNSFLAFEIICASLWVISVMFLYAIYYLMAAPQSQVGSDATPYRFDRDSSQFIVVFITALIAVLAIMAIDPVVRDNALGLVASFVSALIAGLYLTAELRFVVSPEAGIHVDQWSVVAALMQIDFWGYFFEVCNGLLKLCHLACMRAQRAYWPYCRGKRSKELDEKGGRSNDNCCDCCFHPTNNSSCHCDCTGTTADDCCFCCHHIGNDVSSDESACCTIPDLWWWQDGVQVTDFTLVDNCCDEACGDCDAGDCAGDLCGACGDIDC